RGALDTSESAGSRAPEGGGSPDSDEAAFGNAFVSFSSSGRPGSSSAAFEGTDSTTSSDYGSRPDCSGRRGRLATLPDLGGLAVQVAEVVQLRTTHVTALDNLDLGDVRRVHRERTLHADTEGDLAHGEGLADTTALAADDHAFEHLVALAVALDDADVDLQRVARAKVGDVRTQRLGLQRVQRVHRCPSSSLCGSVASHDPGARLSASVTDSGRPRSFGA